MSYYDDDEVLAELHDELYSIDDKDKDSKIESVDPKIKFWAGILIGGVILLIFFKKITLGQGLMVAGVIIAVVMMTVGIKHQKKELSMVELLMRLNDTLLFLQKHPIGYGVQVPPGIIDVKLTGKRQLMQGEPYKRSFAVDIWDEDTDITEHYCAEVNVFTGDIVSFKHFPQGVTGNEKKDIIFLATPDMTLQKRRDKYLGGFGKKYG